MSEATARKELDVADLLRLERRTVVAPPYPDEQVFGGGGDFGWVYWWGQAADIFPQWGTQPAVRDARLRAFFIRESILASAIGSIVARNIGYDWKLTGPERQVAIAHDMLTQANKGRGWNDFMSRFFLDYYTQDRGCFVEIIRASDAIYAPPIGIQTLDAARCWRTRDDVYPVIYQDRRGKYHRMRFDQVAHNLELASPQTLFSDLQYCGVSRVLAAARIWSNIDIYMEEKTGGRHTRAVHVLSGVQPGQVQAALNASRNAADQEGYTRYANPTMVYTAKAEVEPKLVTLEMAGLPDGWDAEKEFRKYMTVLSLGLFTDFQEFAPLPGGNLGTAMQSQILHLKSRGKGPQLAQKTIEHLMNNTGILPPTVTFAFDEQDLDADKVMADTEKVRADTWDALISAGVIDPQAARQLMLDSGMLPQEVFDRLDGMDLQPMGDVTGPEFGQGTLRPEGEMNVLPEEDNPASGQRALPLKLAGGEAVEDARTKAERKLGKAVRVSQDQMLAAINRAMG